MARNFEAFQFLSKAPRTEPNDSIELTEAGQAWIKWSMSGMEGPPPPFNLMSEEGPVVMREQFEPRRRAIRHRDPTIDRRYAVLPPSS